MKSFMKFAVTVLVTCVVSITVYYMVTNSAQITGLDLSGDFDKDSEILDDMLDKPGEKQEDNSSSQEISGEVLSEDIMSGEELIKPEITKEELITLIDGKVKNLNSGELLSSISEKLSSELVSESARSFMTYFKINELPTTINIREKCIEIIPTSDFLENMVYYYDENGNLILFESVSNTVGGSSKYYFYEKNSVEVVFDYDEDVINNEEYVFDVLNRGNILYDKYLRK